LLAALPGVVSRTKAEATDIHRVGALQDGFLGNTDIAQG
jgi:hypothetical protein